MFRTAYSLTMLALVTIVLTILVVLTGIVTRSKRAAYTYVRLWARTLIALFRIDIHVSGAEDVDFDRPMLYMSNHVSQADIPILMTAIPAGLAFVSKASLAHIPFLSWSMRMVGMVFISRRNSEQATEILNNAAKEVPRDMNLIIFPEGTRSKTGSGVLNPIKKGGFHMAIASARPIQPVVIVGSENVLPRGTMSIRSGSVQVRLGHAITVTPESTVEQLMQDYTSEMQRLLGEASPHYGSPEKKLVDANG